MNHSIGHNLSMETPLYCNCTELETDSFKSIQWRGARIISGGTISTPIRCLHEELVMGKEDNLSYTVFLENAWILKKQDTVISVTEASFRENAIEYQHV